MIISRASSDLLERTVVVAWEDVGRHCTAALKLYGALRAWQRVLAHQLLSPKAFSSLAATGVVLPCWQQSCAPTPQWGGSGAC